MISYEEIKQNEQLYILELNFNKAYGAMAEMGQVIAQIQDRDDAEVVLSGFEFYFAGDDLLIEEHQTFAQTFDYHYCEYREAMTVLLENLPATQDYVNIVRALQNNVLTEEITDLLASFEENPLEATTPPSTPMPFGPPVAMNDQGTGRGLYFAPCRPATPSSDGRATPTSPRRGGFPS